MKVLGIVGSPRKGNTEALVCEAFLVLQAEGLDTEMVQLAEMRIEPCDGCNACRLLSEGTKDDDFQPLFQKMVEADGLIVGSPVYFSGPTPNILALLHRAGYLSQAVWGDPLSGR